MLDQDKFLEMKEFAKKVRKENENKFKEFDKDEIEDAIKEKDELIESLIENMEINFDEGDEGKEERQIFRANLLIPDDLEFFESYSKDKNVRNLMNKYSVGIEDIMSKITELNLYSKYIDTFGENDDVNEDDIAEHEEGKDDFVDGMVDLSSEEAENMLGEIEDLSSAMEDLDIKADDKEDEGSEDEGITIKPQTLIEEDNFQQIEEAEDTAKEDSIDNDIEISDEIENISSAVSEFVDEYSKVKRELEFTQAKVDKFNSEKEELRKKYNASKDENEVLEKENNSLRDEIEKIYAEAKKISEEKEELRKKLSETKEEMETLEEAKRKVSDELDKVMYEAEKLAAENNTLKSQIKSMEKTVKQSTDLLKEIYKSIPKKRFNIK